MHTINNMLVPRGSDQVYDFPYRGKGLVGGPCNSPKLLTTPELTIDENIGI